MSQPNILILMTDQMQGRLLDADHPCRIPNLRALAARGVRFSRAYTPNPVCSPARASLMTGRLPHSHGVVQVTHCVEPDQACLREHLPHFAQRLAAAGYDTAYFGKWHADHEEDPTRFGWRLARTMRSPQFPARQAELLAGRTPRELWRIEVTEPRGYAPALLCAVNDLPADARKCAVSVTLAMDYLREALTKPDPWCCFVSVDEPHDPFVCSEAAYAAHETPSLALPANFADAMADKPGLYRKAARAWANLTDDDKRRAMACYYGMMADTDSQFGRILDLLAESGRLDDTIVVLTADHGEFLGAHGLYTKNTGAFEEAYNIPMVVAGPGMPRGVESRARVGLHDLCPTLCELAGAEPIDTAGESRSLASLLRDPATHEAGFATGFAEYYGTRYWLTQRVYWEGDWKFVFNGFDEDELYDLANDPGELHNLAADPAYRPRVEAMMTAVWRIIRDTKDMSLVRSGYPSLRYAVVGPEAAD